MNKKKIKISGRAKKLNAGSFFTMKPNRINNNNNYYCYKD